MVVALPDGAEAPKGPATVELGQDQGSFGGCGVQRGACHRGSTIVGADADLDGTNLAEGTVTIDGGRDNDPVRGGRKGAEVHVE